MRGKYESANFAMYTTHGMTVFSPTMKLADLVGLNYQILKVLSRLDISLGFREHTVEQVCDEYGINVDSFLLICNVYAFPGYIPSLKLIAGATPEPIVKYLHNSHVLYLREDLAGLEEILECLMKPCDAHQQKVVRKFFEDYRDEARNHFNYEETVLFPYIASLEEGRRDGSFSISTFEDNHNSVDEKLNDLKNIVMKYLPECCDARIRNEVLFRIFQLAEDLERHTAIEDKVLVKIVMRLEAQYNGNL